ncbi:hypothetical protein PGT21_018774, partial [Puccinia graminis f. sp. tritici]
MTKIIAENTAKSEQACSELTTSVNKLNADLTSTADYIVSTLKQDAILENSANKSELDIIKDLLIQQNIRTEGLKKEFSEQMKLLQSNLSQEIKSSIQSIVINAVPQLNYPVQVEPLVQTNSQPRFNNPYMEEVPQQNVRDAAPHLRRSQINAGPQQHRNTPPHL